MIAPLPFQIDAITRHAALLQGPRRASLDASVPGFGKTFVAAFVFKQLGLRPGVLCPKSIITQWRRALDLVGVEPWFVTNYEQAKLDKFAHGKWKVRNRVYEWNQGPGTGLVFDEVHRCKERTTQNAKLLVAARRDRVPTLALSATAAQDPLDLYALGYLLGLHSGVDFLSFAFAHGVIKGRFTFEFRGGQPALEKLNAILFPDRGFRATYADIPGFPSEVTEAVSLDIPEKFASDLDEHWARVQELQEKHDEAVDPIVARLRARQIAELAKVPAMVEMIRDLVAEGMSVPVFVAFKDTVNALNDHFKFADRIEGGQSARERDEAIDRFQRDERHVILCQHQAGGTGISLHDTIGNRPRCSVISPPESARDLIQILGRNRRAGQKTPAFRKIVFAAGTVEEKVRRAVEKKVKQIELINDGDLDVLSL